MATLLWSAPRVVTSGKVHYRTSVIHGLPVTLRMLSKSEKSAHPRIRNEFSAQAQKMGPSQRWQFMVLTRITAASVDENVLARQTLVNWTIYILHVRFKLFYFTKSHLGSYFYRAFESGLHSLCSCLQGRSLDSFPKQQLVIERKSHCLWYFQSTKTISFVSSPSFPMVQQMRSKMQE